MWSYPKTYDVIVMGAGHAGCEAAHASSKMGHSTLLLTMNLDTIGKMSCNPAVGGIGKGHMVREIDAMGGIMGKVTDRTAIQRRMLNSTRGPAVQAPRAQADKAEYALEMKRRLELVSNLEIKQGTIEDIVVENGKIVAVITKEGIRYNTKTLILSSGTFMRGLLHIGEVQYSGGRAGDQPSVGLSKSLENFDIKLGRLKTGTPPRVNARSIDFSKTEIQPGEPNVKFSYDDEGIPDMPQVPCYITYTTEATKTIIQENLHRSAMYSGRIHSVGPRYCPSIEDKVVRFSDKERHQIFLEPEGLKTAEIYVNGVSSSMPFDVQKRVIESIIGLENAEIMRPAYAIEYDYVLSGQMTPALHSTHVEGLFYAGQINGTTGYEEAAAQGLVAGINAGLFVQGKAPFHLSRTESYIGVMIDDLTTKGVTEPYRMFTSRAERRLLLRQDNADLRLREYGYQFGMVDKERYDKLVRKKDAMEKETLRFTKIHKQMNGKGYSLYQLLSRPELSYNDLLRDYPDVVQDYGVDTNQQIELSIKYAGYIEREESAVKSFSHLEKIKIPNQFDFLSVIGLRNEARSKFNEMKPITVGQASRIPGVSPADISVLMVAITKAGDKLCQEC